MGGVDICFGRWDTNAYPNADAHRNNSEDLLYPGQDFMNARAFNFTAPDHPKETRLNRNTDYRMGWTDPAVCLEGPVVQDLVAHFSQRWNFERERSGEAGLQARLCRPPAWDRDRNEKIATAHASMGYHDDQEITQSVMSSANHTAGKASAWGQKEEGTQAAISVQIVRSICKWNHGTTTEHSILDAYLDIIEKSQHFLYFEQQYFITATTEEQYPVRNKIGKAIVDRILRAARAKQRFKVIIVMPAVPAFAGDIQYDSSPGTLAIMGFQFKSISKGGSSILEKIREAGFVPEEYISFFNLRSYDRINPGTSPDVPKISGNVNGNAFCGNFERSVANSRTGSGEDPTATSLHPESDAAQHQQTQSALTPSYDSISSAYLLDGPAFSSITLKNGNVDEIETYVSEEVYVHSKLLIADDRIVIIGSANLGDRSMIGDRDSELAVVIEDSIMIDSQMNGEPFKAARFAASMRRNLFRKHLGLVHPQDPTKPDDNSLPIDKCENMYDWGSDPDILVTDPLSNDFENLWSRTARINTEIFEKVFRPVPSNAVRDWEQYHEYYGRYFDVEKGSKRKPMLRYGHVFKENFPDGVQDLENELDKVRGTLVEMPLGFLAEVKDLEREGFGDQPFQAELYT
ncbi:hypothetical protein ONS95_012987 [Cadophora gregata]|uniref:uncharacterized protein n=1 Tax=Cadophora gregata TaxID=51156 RepID=UPI0026DBEFA8|nr:uncharacterized protein ONS95_012987 [Cadophora gregata]KAK0115945.1 hypothetical protein ONS95_012987 [Cadophora gregata]